MSGTLGYSPLFSAMERDLLKAHMGLKNNLQEAITGSFVFHPSVSQSFYGCGTVATCTVVGMRRET